MRWHTEVRKISELKNWEGNPRTISEEAYKELKESINDLGNFEPLVINTDGTVLAGNQRLRIHLERGDKEVEVSVPERELTENEIKKIGIISNRHLGEWDMDKLANEFEDVIEELGFDDLLPEEVLDVKEDDYEEPEDLETTVKLGDVYQLGEHYLMCGDSTKIKDVERLMNGEKATLIFTSPPYNMGGEMYKYYSDNKKSEEYIRFNLDVVNIWRNWLDGYLFWNISYNKNSRWEFLEIMYRIIKETGLRFLELVIWDKKTAMPVNSQKQLTRTYEDILVVGEDDNIQNDYTMFGLSTDRREEMFNKRTGLTMTNYWRIRPSNIQVKGLNEACYPIELPARAIDMVTRAKEIVADPFGGSGSTLIACEQTNRKCYMMELDPHYCQVVIDRWEKFTGKKAIKLD
jgi:site-specific DNA-methyltransferase (adenine-specific)